MQTPPIASTLSPTDAWLFFGLLVGWTVLALYGLGRVVPFFVRWHNAYTWMLESGIDGERRTRAKGLRRRSGFFTIILGTYTLVGLARYLAPPGTLTAGLIGGALLLTALLIVVDIELEGRDIEHIARVRAAKRSRASD